MRRMGYAAEYCADYSVRQGRCLSDRPDTIHAAVTSLADVQTQIEAVGKRVLTIDMMWIHTHGAPGYVHLPGGGITESNVGTLRPACSTYLAMPATIIFAGCNVGEGGPGERFLKAAGAAMLGHGGGHIVSSDSVTFSVPLLGQRRPIWSSIVEASVAPGGAVTVVTR